MTINTFRYFIYAFGIILAFSNCSGNEKSEKKKTDQKTENVLLYNIPPPKELSETERHKINAQCQLFYDTVLSPSAFNGGIIVAKGGNIVFEKYRCFINTPAAD